MMRLPIRTRLTVVYCTVFCASTLLLECGAYMGLRTGIHSVMDAELEARTAGVVEFLGHHVARMPLGRLQKELGQHAALQPDFLSVQRASGEWLWHPPRMVSVAAKSGAAPTVWTAEGLRIRRSDRVIQDERYRLDVATDLTLAFEILRRFRLFALLSSPLVLAGASLLGYWVSGRALHPVSQMTTAARAIGAANLGDRLAVPASNDELQQLAVTINGMLARIEDSFRQVTQFTANASHELRTPLAVMRTTAEVALLRVRPTVESYREALLRILEESEKNSILLDDMLRLARADSGAGLLNLQPVDLLENLRQARDQLAPIAEDNGLTLQLTADAEAAETRVRADANHLRRVWLILLDNAIKYTASGGRIGIGVSVMPGYVLCWVTDTGIGISPSDLPHIFERFYRSDKARKREQGGAGLGLSIAQWIVDVHHARIEVESSPGMGSTFRVRIPLLAPEPDRREAATLVAHGEDRRP